MKIAIQIANYYPIIGGAEVFAKEVAEYLVKKGHEVDVITVRLNSKLKEYEQIEGVNVYRAKALKVRYLNVASVFWALTCKLMILEKRRNYDVLHSMSEFAIESCGIIKKFWRKKHIVTIQGGDLMDYKSYKSRLDRIREPIVSYSLKNADMVHAVSNYIEKRAKELGAKDTIIIPNGVNTSRFKPMNKEELREKHGYSWNEKIIISTSRLTPKNGLHHLIKATAKISNEIPDIRLVIVGDGVQRDELKKLIKELKLDDKVQLLDFIPHTKLPEYLNIADGFIRPSLEEGFGISFIEAMACRIPTIGSKVGGILDIIEDGRNGLMVTPGDVEDIAQKVITLLSQKELADRLAMEGYKTVHERFTWDVVLKKIESLYEKLMEDV